MERLQDPMYNATQEETFESWRTIAQHFSGHNTIAFYELTGGGEFFKQALHGKLGG
jgi:hypothetical protein